MSLISKYSDINKNLFVLGAFVIKLLKNKNLTIEKLFQESNRDYEIELNSLLNVVSFLWLLELVTFEENTLSLNKS